MNNMQPSTNPAFPETSNPALIASASHTPRVGKHSQKKYGGELRHQSLMASLLDMN